MQNMGEGKLQAIAYPEPTDMFRNKKPVLFSL